MRKILIIGATSGMAEATARIWSIQGCELFLVARNSQKLEAIAEDLRVRGGGNVYTYVMDANVFEQHESMYRAANETMKGVDVVLIAHGTLSDQSLCQNSIEKTLEEIRTNALSVIALLTMLTNEFEQKNAGTIAVISSVAGDRGRKSNYIYGAAKGFVTRFVEGMQHRFAQSNVNIVLIKPGPTETAMTAHLKGNQGVKMATVETVAKLIVEAIDKKLLIAYAPKKWKIIMLIIRHIPFRIFKKMNI